MFSKSTQHRSQTGLIVLLVMLGSADALQARFKNIADDNYDYAHQRLVEQLEKVMKHARDSHARNSEISDMNKHILKAKRYADEAYRAYQNELSQQRHRS
ncbi:MAG TPA: hypothetical protein VJJ83_01345 [Candidatus Babeliales bacterium]|nr:hypothetical protein [Candidatus Babeliales bacterium]